ncbi:MAG: AIPR family protein [Acetobacteraceae bacterium]
MTDEEFRADLLAAAAARAEAHETSLRDGFTSEVLERLRDAGEVPDAESCAEALTGQRSRRLEVDAFAFDDADESLHLFVAVRDGGAKPPPAMTLTEARDQGFGRLLGVFEQARDGWLAANIEESRPLWALARRVQTEGKPAALRLHVLTDRPTSERLREIKGDRTREGIPVTFQIWDVTRLKRIHEARSVRDDLFVDLSALPGGGLAALPAAVGASDYDAFLAVVPGEILADIYIEHGSRLLEGNVRTYLGRRGNINRGIAATLSNEPARFFAYNNGIAATASEVRKTVGPGGGILLTGVTDLQIVNGAQTTASLAALRRAGKLSTGAVCVPMKLSVVAPEVAETLIPRISRYANTQNTVRASDFFANHPFHQRTEGISRRILAPAVGGSLTQTHWYYERARGQHLNDQAGLTPARKEQFLRRNPRGQLITKTDLAKVESCFNLLPDVACKGAEKAFVAFAERVTEDWKDERRRSAYSDDWYRCAVARIILFRTTEALVSKATWYEGGYRAQVVAYATARLAALADERSGGGRLDYLKVWSAQAAGEILEKQLLAIAEAMMRVLRAPPHAGQNVSEWAKQQACRRQALETDVPVEPRFATFLLGKEDARSAVREDQEQQRIADGVRAVAEVMAAGAGFWSSLRVFACDRRLTTAEDESALTAACSMPRRIPTDWQAAKLLAVRRRCEEAGFVA